MNVIHGRVPTELLNSKISQTDRDNLSTLIPHLLSSNVGTEDQPMTYQDVYQVAQAANFGRGTEVSEEMRLNNLSTLVPRTRVTENEARKTETLPPPDSNEQS